MKRTYATQEWHDFAGRVLDKLIENTRGVPNPDKLYKVMMHEAPNDPVLRCVCWIKRTTMYCLAVQNHNMSKTSINSTPHPHALNMLIGLSDGSLQRFQIAPATEGDFERFNKVWPGYLHEAPVR